MRSGQWKCSDEISSCGKNEKDTDIVKSSPVRPQFHTHTTTTKNMLKYTLVLLEKRLLTQEEVQRKEKDKGKGLKKQMHEEQKGLKFARDAVIEDNGREEKRKKLWMKLSLQRKNEGMILQSLDIILQNEA
ncbi:hypothetical protein Tco_0185093 [Tanacetum coccineum]